MARTTKATEPAVDEPVDETAAPAEPAAAEQAAAVDQVDDVDQVDGLDAIPDSGIDDDEPEVPEDVTGRTIWPGSI